MCSHPPKPDDNMTILARYGGGCKQIGKQGTRRPEKRRDAGSHPAECMQGLAHCGDGTGLPAILALPSPLQMFYAGPAQRNKARIW